MEYQLQKLIGEKRFKEAADIRKKIQTKIEEAKQKSEN